MASAKEYSMLFKLSAKLGSEFSGTFGKAQKSISDVQRQMSELAKAQSDISAYQRQEKAVEATERKLRDLKAQYDNIQREMSETGEYSSALENRLIDKQRAIDKTNTSLEAQKAKLGAMGQSLREAGHDTNNLTEESAKLAQKQDELAREYQETAKAADDFGKTGSGAFAAVGDALIAAGILKGLQEIYSAYKECVGVAMEFGSTMSAVEALSGATADEMARLTAKAEELGATTKFTANEAATAMTYMGMAGWDANDMLSGMSGVMNLAAASGEDLARVSDIVTDNLTAFGLKASDAAHFADVLAATATNSNTNVSIMGETFRNCAPQAAALGYSVEDVSVAIGLMANAGIKGSVAGTALKNVFNGMLGEIKLTSQAFGEVTYSAIKSDGTMKSFSETLDDLRVYFNKMTGAEKMQNAQLLVGERAMAGFVTLMNSASDDVKSLTDNIENCAGAAERMAEVRMDNLKGQLTLMNSATDALKTTLGSALEPELRKLTKVATEIITQVNEFLKKNPALTKGLVLLVGTLGGLIALYKGYKLVRTGLSILKKTDILLTAKETASKLALTGALGAETAATGAATTAQHGLNSAMLANPIGLMIAGLAALTVGLVAYSSKAKAEMDAMLQDANNLKDAVKEYNDTVRELTSTYDDTVGKSELQASTALEYIKRLEELEVQGVRTTEQQKEYAETVAKLHALMPDLNLAIDEQTGLLKNGAKALEEQVKNWREKIKLQALESLTSQRMEAQISLTLDRDKAQEAYNDALEQYENYLKQYKATYGKEADVGRMVVQQGYSGAALQGLDKSLVDTHTQLTLLEMSLNEANAVLAESEAETDALAQAYAEAADSIGWFNDGVASTSETVNEASDNLGNATLKASQVQEALQNISAAYLEAYEAAKQSLEGQYKLWDNAAEVVPKKVGEMTKSIETQAAYWHDYNQDLEALLGRAKDIEGLQDILATFADGSKESVDAVAGMAQASDEDLQKMVENWQALQEQQGKAAEALAEVRTGYSDELLLMQDDMEEAIKGLDLAEDSKQAGAATIRAYVDALRSGTLDAVSAAQNIAALVNSAFSGQIKPWQAPRQMPRNYVSEYASGTDNARAGWAWVGEQGPELMYMRGGETVIPHNESVAMLRDRGGVNLTVAPTYQITGASGNIEDALRQSEQRTVQAVLDVLREREMDRMRGAYS